MLLIGRKIFTQWLLITAILFGGCGPPVTTRLVTIELEKPSEVDLQRVKAIGVLPFSSPDPVVGRKMAEMMVKELGHGPLEQGPFAARIIRPPSDFKPEAKTLSRLCKKAQVDGLLLGEITEFSVQALRDTARMLSVPNFGPDDPSQFGWVGVTEKPSIRDTYYYRIKPLQDPEMIEVSITIVAFSMATRLRLIEPQNGSTLWEKEIARNYERISLPGYPMKTEDEVERLMASIVEEVVARLKPQESSVQRILRAPHFAMTPVAAKWVRRGIQAGAQGNWLEAERLFLQAIKEAPNECTVNGNLGVAYEKNGRLLEAVAAYERAYRCQPRDPTYRYYSDDLQTAFVPDLKVEQLPTIVLGVRGDGIVYLDGGESLSHHAGQEFTIYRTQVVREQNGFRIKSFKEIELAHGRIIEANEGMSLGQLLLYNPETEVRRGDLFRVDGR